LFQEAANVVSRYAHVAQQVSQFILPDLQLAVQEHEPEMASGLLTMVRDWVAEMKTEGLRTQQKYVELQTAVLGLVRRAQSTKQGADRRLFEAVKAVETEVGPSSASSSQSLAVKGSQLYSGVCGSTPDAKTTSTAGDTSAAVKVDVPPSLNMWTQQLFDQLQELKAPSSQKSTCDTTGKVPSVSTSPDDLWKRDVLELLFMAPGIAPSSLPKVESVSFAHDTKDDEHASYSDSVHVEDDLGDSIGRAQQPDSRNAVVRYVQSENVKSEAESATHSSTALMRALRELKRVDGILQGCSAFWANMDGTVQRLAQMKEHTESLVHVASKSGRLRQRFEQRLGEYVSFWASLERLCRQYCKDHQEASGRMQEFVRETTDIADLLDTAQSAKAGVLLANAEKQLRHRG
jgi:hypothetical protein